MSLPEIDGLLDPALCIRAHAQAEAMAGVPELVEFDFDSGLSQVPDAPLHGRRRSTIRSSSLTVMKVGGKSPEKLAWPV